MSYHRESSLLRDTIDIRDSDNLFYLRPMTSTDGDEVWVLFDGIGNPVMHSHHGDFHCRSFCAWHGLELVPVH
jgi:hypothetical protein